MRPCAPPPRVPVRVCWRYRQLRSNRAPMSPAAGPCAKRSPPMSWCSPARMRCVRPRPCAACAMRADDQCWRSAMAPAARSQRLGVDAMSPTRMDSEGLLAMPALRDIGGRRVGLVTAPGGRNRLAPALQSRGAEVRRADVYDRTPVTIAAARWQALAIALETPDTCRARLEQRRGTGCRASPASRPSRKSAATDRGDRCQRTACPGRPRRPVSGASRSPPMRARPASCAPPPMPSFSIAG